MITPELKIPSVLYVQMLSHAQEEWPNEACGIIAGDEETVLKIYPADNQEKSPYKFLISPKEQIRILNDIEINGYKMIGVYHSHPNTDPYPSETDLKFSLHLDMFLAIISLKRREKPRLCIFRIDQHIIKEIHYKLI